MTKPETYTTASGRKLTDADLDAIADEVEGAEYDVEELKTRRRGQPPFGSAPADSEVRATPPVTDSPATPPGGGYA